MQQSSNQTKKLIIALAALLVAIILTETAANWEKKHLTTCEIKNHNTTIKTNIPYAQTKAEINKNIITQQYSNLTANCTSKLATWINQHTPIQTPTRKTTST